MKTITDLVGRILFAIPFGFFGLFHFMNAGDMAGLVPLPGGVFWVYLVGLALLAAAAAILTNIKGRLALQLLGVLLLVFVFSIHLPGVMGGNEDLMPSLLKDTSLAGAAFWLSGIMKK